MPRSAALGFIMAVTGIVLIVALLTACGPAGPAASVPASATQPAPSSEPSPRTSASANTSAPSSAEPDQTVWLPEWAGDDVPAEIANRRPLPFCGIERPPAPQPGIFVDRAVRLCFWNAHLARTEAEFVSLQSTMEGNPIAMIYRLGADGTVQLLTDFTQDPFGGSQWTLTTCKRLVEAVEGNELLGTAECDDGVPLN